MWGYIFIECCLFVCRQGLGGGGSVVVVICFVCFMQGFFLCVVFGGVGVLFCFVCVVCVRETVSFDFLFIWFPPLPHS